MRDDDLDHALDGALDGAVVRFSSAEPLTGLEQRVLNRVHAERAVPHVGRFRFGRWAPAVGVAVVAGMVMAAVLWDKPVPPPPPVGQDSRPVPQQAQTRVTPAGFRKKNGQARSPVPLTSEERALLALVARAPDQAREALLDLQRRSTEPIQVAEIRIEPLRSDDAK